MTVRDKEINCDPNTSTEKNTWKKLETPLYLRSISPTFYAQLLRAHIPKAQKDSQLKQLFALPGSAGVKAGHKHIDDIDPWRPSYKRNLDQISFKCLQSSLLQF